MTDEYRIGRILVPVDGSECSRHAAEHGVRLAQVHGAAVIFLHVVDSQVVEQLAQQETDNEQARERLFENGRVYLQDVARLAAERNLPHRE